MFCKLATVMIVVCFGTAVFTKKEIVGYYRSWRVYNTCSIEDINPKLCSILIYAFAGLNTDGAIAILDHNADIAKGGFRKFNALKQQNPHLKTLLSIGGQTGAALKFSRVAANATATRRFVVSALDVVHTHGFDGIDIDWEFPGFYGGEPYDKVNFPAFLATLRGEFDRRGYLVTVAVGVSDNIIEKAYDVPAISRAVHYIHLMTYNMHDYRTGTTGANAPLFSDGRYNVKYCTEAWISKGADPSKLVLGLASYGKTYTLKNSTNHDVGDIVSGPGVPGPRTNDSGTIAYDEIIEYERNGWTKKWSDKLQVPYLYKNDQWVGFDDVRSIRKKVNFANRLNLGGVMMWSVDMDDPRGLGGLPFPLLQSVNKYL